MELPFGPPLLIANLTAGTPSRRTLSELVAALRELGVEPEVATTAGPGHATHLAREAVATGRRFVVAVGGDGTVNEVVNGLVDVESGRPHLEGTVLGAVAAGSGCDLLRTFGLDRDAARVAPHLLGAHTQTLDLGRVRFRTRDGGEGVRLFANVAEAGYGARVAGLVTRVPRRLGPARYAVAVVASAPWFRRVRTRVEVDGGTRSDAVCNVVVANGQFYGGGFHVAPRALPGDGRLDVQTWGGHLVDVVRAQRQLRRGTHLAREDVRAWVSQRVTIDADRALPVEADGEVLGTTPASFEVVPGPLELKT